MAYFQGRADIVVDKMYKLGFIKNYEYERAKLELRNEHKGIEPMVKFQDYHVKMEAPHFVEYIQDELEKEFEEKGYPIELIDSGGLRIITTLDYDLQKKAEEIVNKKAKENETEFQTKNAALISIENKTGFIKVMVGSRDYWEKEYICVENHNLEFENIKNFSHYLKEEEIIKMKAPKDFMKIYEDEKADQAGKICVRYDSEPGKNIKKLGKDQYIIIGNGGSVNAVLSNLAPGSSFKPFVYAAAFLYNNLSPATVLFDVKTTFPDGPVRKYTPRNYDGRFIGPTSIRYALGHSLNIAAVKSALIATPQKVEELANLVGLNIGVDPKRGAAIALGSRNTRPIDLATGFSVFANNGKKRKIISIYKVYDREGNILIDNSDNENNYEEIMPADIAYLITDILKDKGARGAGWNTNLALSDGRDNAVKTGTSNKPLRNNPKKIYPNNTWTAGYTPQLTTVVWAGDNNDEFLSLLASGFSTAAPIWKEFMDMAHQNLPIEKFEVPSGITRIPVSILSGKLPYQESGPELVINEIFGSTNKPTESDSALRFIKVVHGSNLPPCNQEEVPSEVLVNKSIISFHSYYADDPVWENPVQKWVEENGDEYFEKLGVTSVLAKDPKKCDSRYSNEVIAKKPIITILSPINAGLVSPPQIDIRTKIISQNGIKSLKVYWDNDLIKTVSNAMLNLKVNLPENIDQNIAHKIKVVAIDTMSLSSSSEISVKIGQDDSPPIVEIIYPIEGEILPAGEMITFLAKAYDDKSAVSKLYFTLDGQRIGTEVKRPFSLNYKIPNIEGNHKLVVKAINTSNRSAETQVNFQVKKSDLISKAEKFEIISPNNNSNKKAGELVKVKIGISEEIAYNFKLLQLKQGRRTILAEFQKDDISDSRIFRVNYIQPNEDVILQVVVELRNGSFRYSEKVNIKLSSQD